MSGMLMVPTIDRPYKQQILSLKDKIDLIKFSESNNISVRDLAKKFMCGKTQTYNIIKNKQKLKEEWLSGARTAGSKRRTRVTENEQVNCMLYDWYVDAKSRNLPINGPILQCQAKIIATQLGRFNFKASSGWLERFRARHGINLSSSKLKAQAAYLEDLDNWKAKLKDLIKDYNIEDVASCDETSLLYRIMPDKVKGFTNSAHDPVHERLTLLICAFADGTVEPPLIIGSSKGSEMENVNLMWKCNEQAWMTGSIMEEWLNSLNERLELQDRRIMLFLDGVASHPRLRFSNIRLCFIPPNCNELHPMNDIIFNFKAAYRKLLLDHVINNSLESITLNEALGLVEKAYSLDKQCVINCFAKCSFPVEYRNEYILRDNLFVLLKMIRTLQGGASADEYINVDRALATESGFQTVYDLIQAREKSEHEPPKPERKDRYSPTLLKSEEVSLHGYIKAEPPDSDVFQYESDRLSTTLLEDYSTFQYKSEQEQLDTSSAVDTNSVDDSLRLAVKALVQSHHKLTERVQHLEREAVQNRMVITKLQERITLLENPNHEI